MGFSMPWNFFTKTLPATANFNISLAWQPTLAPMSSTKVFGASFKNGPPTIGRSMPGRQPRC